MQTRFLTAAVILALGLATGFATDAGALLGDAYSYSKNANGIPLSSFTKVAKRKLPPGSYAVTSTGTIRNDSTTQGAYVACSFEGGPGVTVNFVNYDGYAPIALGPGVGGPASWALTTTVEVADGDDGTLSVVCVNFGPAADANVKAWWPSIVAIKVGNINHKLAP